MDGDHFLSSLLNADRTLTQCNHPLLIFQWARQNLADSKEGNPYLHIHSVAWRNKIGREITRVYFRFLRKQMVKGCKYLRNFWISWVQLKTRQSLIFKKFTLFMEYRYEKISGYIIKNVRVKTRVSEAYHSKTGILWDCRGWRIRISWS